MRVRVFYMSEQQPLCVGQLRSLCKCPHTMHDALAHRSVDRGPACIAMGPSLLSEHPPCPTAQATKSSRRCTYCWGKVVMGDTKEAAEAEEREVRRATSESPQCPSSINSRT